MIRRYPAFVLAALLACLALPTGCRPLPPAPDAPVPLLLISLDGFRPDYLERYEAPTLRRLAGAGVFVPKGMQPAFPSKTFPNHYTLVTGLYPAHHGIIANTMYDPGMDAWFSLSNRDAVADGRWWGGEPLWVTAEKQGLRAGTYFWPGTEAEIGGVRPSFWKPFDDAVPGAERVDTLLAWLDLPPGRRPTFLTLYFSDVDTEGHRHGPDSEETARAVRTVDGYLARLVDGLKARGLYNRVNLIIVADHGMAPTDPDHVVAIDDYLDMDDVVVTERSPVLMLRPKPGREAAVYAALKGAHPHLQVYRRDALPARWHFDGNPRIPPIIAVADEGWRITTDRPWYAQHRNRFAGGDHGYDNAVPSMSALFVAHGPGFRQGLRVDPFANIHLYTLMAHLLGLTPAPNDGDFDAVRHLLR